MSSRKVELAEALLDIAAEGGLDRVSVREVAAAARVSIGAVQHHFSTKDDMLVFAFEYVVDRSAARVAALPQDGPIADVLRASLLELLPLDAGRHRETSVYVAFAARAAVSPRLAEVHRRTHDRIRTELAEALTELGADDPARDAAVLLSALDGLIFTAITEPGTYSPADLEAFLDRYLQALLG
ncbi:MAG TPA: TetR/AcrR family transcriptional regulator [Mycobacteriales bacterium]|nr:TetR/AcrR family transcriptional regulator [Mycobacteriales bacterium]